MQNIKWTNSVNWRSNGPKYMPDFTSHIIKTIKNTVEGQIEIFLKENNISVEKWQKYGIIQRLPDDINGLTYILYYKKWNKKFEKKIRIEYSTFIIN